VLRLQEGDLLTVADGEGSEADAAIETLSKKEATITVAKIRTVKGEPTRHVTLYCSLLRRENFEWVVQKATEVGVREIIPILSERTVKTGIKMERLEKIAREAVEQCGRGILPSIAQPTEFEDALEQSKNGKNIFFHLGATDTLWKSDLGTECAVWIGPEGGWTDDEAEQAKEHGHIIASLGTLTLRGETAAVVAAFEAVNA
jgi:16S rRNA (uracil1498-N3)-methyltransferase